jgi:hypothetical protein
MVMDGEKMGVIQSAFRKRLGGALKRHRRDVFFKPVLRAKVEEISQHRCA